MERTRTLSCAGRLRGGDREELQRLIPELDCVFKGHYLGSIPCDLPADEGQHAAYVAELLKSMHVFQLPSKV